jgi:hypothetical protein
MQLASDDEQSVNRASGCGVSACAVYLMNKRFEHLFTVRRRAIHDTKLESIK